MEGKGGEVGQKTMVCFGDSLTLGYQSPTYQNPYVVNVPYGTYLQKWAGERARIVTQGVCGDTTQEMAARFHREVILENPDWVVILGGTNDLGYGAPPSEILGRLERFYGMAQKAGIQPVGVTVPSIGLEWLVEPSPSHTMSNPEEREFPEGIRKRLELNQHIQRLGEERHFPVIDLFSETCDPVEKTLADPFSQDGLHLTVRGYMKLAELIWIQVLQPELEPDSPQKKGMTAQVPPRFD